MKNKNISKEDLKEYLSDKSKYASLSDLFDDSCNKFANDIAFENMGAKLSFKRFQKLSCDLACYFMHETNLKKGDRIAIQMPNTLQYMVALNGALKAGLVVVNINPLYTTEEMKVQIIDSEVKAIVILENFAHKLEEILNTYSFESIIITKIGDLMGKLKGFIVNNISKYVKKIIPNYQIENCINFNKTLGMGSKHEYIKPIIHKEDLAFIQYTTGTTGTAKGAILTHNNMLSNLCQVSVWMKKQIKERQGDEIAISPLPLYHVFSLIVSFIMIRFGTKNVLITNPRDLNSFIKELKKYSFSLLTGVNTLFKALLNHSKFKNVDFSNCKIVMGGAASIQSDVINKWYKLTGTNIVEAYGLTEASPGVAANDIRNPKIGSVGFPFIDTEVKIIDEDERELKEGQRGELIVKGPQIMKGYWNNKQETDKALVNGWLKTGDIATIDSNGYIDIVDRKKEIVIISGFNVYPNEIDNVVTQHPKVLEAATIGIPDEKTGEALKLFIVKKDKSLLVPEVITFCRKKLTGYKIPRYIEFRANLPKSAVGKISKKDLKEEYIASK